MVDYQTATSDTSSFTPLKLLVASERFDLSRLGNHSITKSTDTPANDLQRYFPDALLIDAAFVDQDLATSLKQPHFNGLPVLVATAEQQADQASLLLDTEKVSFLDENTSAETLVNTVNSLQAVQHAAEATDMFNPLARIETLRRDAERVAAALAELVAGRPDTPAVRRPVDAPRIRAHIRARRLREKFFPQDVLADPGWDMLLDLAAARLEGQPVAVSSLCIAASVPTTTGLRWIKGMIDRGFFQRENDPNDARRSFITMTEPTIEIMDACLEAVFNHPGQ